MDKDEVRHLKNITQENAMLKKLLAERDLEIEIMKEIAAKMVSAPARRIAALYAIERGASHRRACALMQVSRSTLKYVPTLPMKNAPVVNAMRKLSGQYPRYGYRRINVFLERDGIVIGEDKCGRLWAENGLQVPRKRPCRRIATSRPRPFAPARPNSVWSYDFVFDACANGQQVKCLTVVDEYTRESLAIDVAGSIRSARVIEVLSKLISIRGAPRYLRSDNGPEFVSRALLKWVTEQAIELALIDPGKPWQMVRQKVSMENSETNASPWNGFVIVLKPRLSLKTGAGITIR